jgi:hypothetical protein
MVSDSDNNPVPDALVETTFGGDWDGSRSDTTDGSGEASMQSPRVKDLSFVSVCVDQVIKAGWALDIPNSMLCGDSNGGGSAFGTVDGKVTNAATTGGIPNASVSTDTGQSTNTNSFGDYSIPNVPIGNRTVSVTASTFDGQNKAANVTENSTTTVNFELNETQTGGPGSIKGTVKSGNAKLNGATITVIGGSSSQSNKGGKYSIQNVPAGEQTVVASKSGYLSQTLVVTVIAGGSVDLNFNLAPSP